MLIGGFPCQSFSVAGKRKGFNDIRGTLFFEIARILRDKRPRYFLLENVKGLLSHDDGKTFSTILGILTDIGYELQWQVLNSKNFGVQQNRERVFIIGHIRGECRPKVFPIGEGIAIHEITQNGIYREFITNTITKSYGKLTGCSTKINTGKGYRINTEIECERLQGFPDDWTKYGLFDDGKKEISDTRRYQTLGNAVSTPVITAIIERLIE